MEFNKAKFFLALLVYCCTFAACGGSSGGGSGSENNSLAIDIDGDGISDGVLVDTNGDGTYDGIDTDGDGISDMSVDEATGQSGSSSTPSVDTNGDGKNDGTLVDSDGDGTYDGVDTDGDGKADLMLDEIAGQSGSSSTPSVDTNGDGKSDGSLVDSDGDGTYDGVDTDGDGKADLTLDDLANGSGDSIELAVETDATLLAIGYSDGDNASSVTTHLRLPTSGANGTTIAWSASKSLIAADGKVSRPTYSSGNASVKLTAKVALGTVSKELSFDLTVIKAPATDAEAVAEDFAKLSIGYAEGDSENGVTQNISLSENGACGSTISWSSDQTPYIADSGDFTAPIGGDVSVVLTATISRGSVSDTKTFNMTATSLYTISGSITGLSAEGLTLQLNGANELVIPSAATEYTFTTAIPNNTAYTIRVKAHANNLDCVLSNKTGTISGANISNVDITCGAIDYSGLFEVSDSGLKGFSESHASFADLNGDGYVDLFLSGKNDDSTSGNVDTQLLFNDGTGNFILSEQSTYGADPLFPGSYGANVSFIDVEGDGDPDIFMAHGGQLFLNDGNGIFTKDEQSAGGSSAVFSSMSNSSCAVADVDSDGDLDIIHTGYIPSRTYGKIYLNNGLGKFVAVDVFTGLHNGDVSIADVDNDGDIDIFVTGYWVNGHSSDLRSCLYLNDGSGSFTKDSQSSDTATAVFVGLSSSDSKFCDIDGDSDLDLIICGDADGTAAGRQTLLYVNDGAGNYSLHSQSSTGSSPLFEGVYQGEIASGDIDGDDDVDLMVTGRSSSNAYTSLLYINNGNGNFVIDNQSSNQAVPTFPGVDYGTIAFADIDNDNDLDIFQTGIYYIRYSDYRRAAKFYLNDGSGKFSGVWSTDYSSQSAGDIDNDGDVDLFISGQYPYSMDGTKFISYLYLNDGNGNMYNSGFEFTGVTYGSSDMADVDGDSDLDLIMTGQNESSEYITQLYINKGSDGFVKSEQSSDGSSPLFFGVYYGDSKFADFDNDGDQDLVLTGNGSSRVYVNDGSGNFSHEQTLSLLRNSRVTIGDIDQDGDIDLILTGGGISGTGSYAIIWTNGTINTNNKCFGSGLFENLGDSLPGTSNGYCELGDADKDGDLDLLIGTSCRLFINNGTQDADPFVLSDQSYGGTNEVFPNLAYSVGKFVDVDNDGDKDIAITGNGGILLYNNDGVGGYTKVSGFSLESTEYGSYQGDLAVFDYDNDGDFDFSVSDSTRTHFYKNLRLQ